MGGEVKKYHDQVITVETDGLLIAADVIMSGQ